MKSASTQNGWMESFGCVGVDLFNFDARYHNLLHFERQFGNMDGYMAWEKSEWDGTGGGMALLDGVKTGFWYSIYLLRMVRLRVVCRSINEAISTAFGVDALVYVNREVRV